ncbi:hypothetical protein PENSPDRAFT_671917 [Peniophora sp. CONT]|nr:hypothetical protein PENSPDRAFT_671917 [Peniophora sp. CONT]
MTTNSQIQKALEGSELQIHLRPCADRGLGGPRVGRTAGGPDRGAGREIVKCGVRTANPEANHQHAELLISAAPREISSVPAAQSESAFPRGSATTRGANRATATAYFHLKMTSQIATTLLHLNVMQHYVWVAGEGRMGDKIKPDGHALALNSWRTSRGKEPDFEDAAVMRVITCLSYLQRCHLGGEHKMTLSMANRLWPLLQAEVNFACQVNTRNERFKDWVTLITNDIQQNHGGVLPPERKLEILTGGAPPGLSVKPNPYQGWLGPAMWWTGFRPLMAYLTRMGAESDYPTRAMICETWQAIVEKQLDEKLAKEAKEREEKREQERLEEERLAKEQEEKRQKDDAIRARIAEDKARIAAMEAELNAGAAVEDISAATARSDSVSAAQRAPQAPRAARERAEAKGKGKAMDAGDSDSDAFVPPSAPGSDSEGAAPAPKTARKKAETPAPGTTATTKPPRHNGFALPSGVSKKGINWKQTANEIYAKGKREGGLTAGDVFSLLRVHGIDEDTVDVLHMAEKCDNCKEKKIPCYFRGMLETKNAAPTCLNCYAEKHRCKNVVLPPLPAGKTYQMYLPSYDVRKKEILKLERKKLVTKADYEKWFNLSNWHALGPRDKEGQASTTPAAAEGKKKKKKATDALTPSTSAPNPLPHVLPDTDTENAVEHATMSLMEDDFMMGPPAAEPAAEQPAVDAMDVDDRGLLGVGPPPVIAQASNKRMRAPSNAQGSPSGTSDPRPRKMQAAPRAVTSFAALGSAEPSPQGLVYPNEPVAKTLEGSRTVQPAQHGEFSPRPAPPAVSSISAPRQQEMQEYSALHAAFVQKSQETESLLKQRIKDLTLQQTLALDVKELKTVVEELRKDVKVLEKRIPDPAAGESKVYVTPQHLIAGAAPTSRPPPSTPAPAPASTLSPIDTAVLPLATGPSSAVKAVGAASPRGTSPQEPAPAEPMPNSPWGSHSPAEARPPNLASYIVPNSLPGPPLPRISSGTSSSPSVPRMPGAIIDGARSIHAAQLAQRGIQAPAMRKATTLPPANSAAFAFGVNPATLMHRAVSTSEFRRPTSPEGLSELEVLFGGAPPPPEKPPVGRQPLAPLGIPVVAAADAESDSSRDDPDYSGGSESHDLPLKLDKSTSNESN